jgi:hypothetical protein
MPKEQVNGWDHACFVLPTAMVKFFAKICLYCATCKDRKTANPPTHIAFFRMCTNQNTKKVSSCTRYICSDCAEGFVEKHHL